MPEGLVVVAGQAGADEVLAVLDAATGKQLDRQTLSVADMVHDAKHDVFYIVESTSGIHTPAPGDQVILHARRFDAVNLKWIELGTAMLPALLEGSLVGLTDRLAYVTFPGGDGAKRGMFLVDTADPKALKAASLGASPPTINTSTFRGFIGLPNLTGPGGPVGIISTTCTGTACDISVLPVNVTQNDPVILTGKVVTSYQSTAGSLVAFAGTTIGGGRFVFGVPSFSGNPAKLLSFNPTSLAAIGGAAGVPFSAQGPSLKSLTFACDDVALLTESNTDQGFFAVPLDTAKSDVLQGLGKPGQRVVYERTTGSVVATFSQGGMFFIRAFKMNGKTNPPKLTERVADWTPPADLDPRVVATRTPPGFICPLRLEPIMNRRTVAPFVLSALFLALSTNALAADVPISEEARKHFVAGVNLLKDPEGARYEEAYREFKAAYAASPSYKILGNLGLTAMKLERDGEAIEAYTRYLTEGTDLDATEKKQIQTDLATLKSGAVRLTITTNVPGVMINDVRVPSRGERVMNVYGPVGGNNTLEIGIRPGHHIITARAPGYEEQSWEMDGSPGGKEAHTFTLKKPGDGAVVAPPPPTASNTSTGAPPPPPPPQETARPTPTGVYIGLAATGALFVGGTITGIMALGKKSDFDKKNDGTDEAGAKDARDSGKSMSLITDILLGGAVIAGGVTTYLYVTRPEEPKVGANKPKRFTLVPTVGTTGGGLVAAGSF